MASVARSNSPESDRFPAAIQSVPVTHDLTRLFSDGSLSISAERLAGAPAPDQLKVMVLMCDFSDTLLYGRQPVSAADSRLSSQTDWYYAAHDSLYFHHLLQDVQDYFSDVSGQAFQFDYLIHPIVAELDKSMAWYGNHPQEGEQPLALAQEVISSLDGTVDFGSYDTVIIVHAGAGEETDILGNSPEQIYTTYLGPEDFAEAVTEGLLDEAGIVTNDMDGIDQPAVIEHVLILPENEYQDPIEGVGGFFGSVGVYCFEVGLRLGMLSLSDFTPAGIPDSQGIGQFGLMGYGLFTGAGIIPSHPCAFNKMLMGWLTPYIVDPAKGGSYNLYPAEYADADSTLARVDIGPSEYWLLEYRLQDPDGNAKYSFPGDLNGNGVPDFKDMDSGYEDFTPTGYFDPAEDEKERLLGGEFDFFMSDNDARAAGVKGAGSGIYIWHIDGGVIQRVIDLPENLLNADPLRKAVDLEEADGIQDLDARIPSPFVLGGDDDSFRGEGTRFFGPDTNPSTCSAGGAPTGIIFDRISNVVAGPGAVDGDGHAIIDYAEFMNFRCRKAAADPDIPLLVSDLSLPQFDLRGADLLAADLDEPQDGILEILAVADLGRLLVFNHDLTGYADSPAGASWLWSTGTDASGQPVQWNSGAVAGDFNGDGRLDVMLTAATGLYAFTGRNGDELEDADGDPDSHGLFYPLTGCSVAPLLRVGPGGSLEALVVEEFDDLVENLLVIDADGLVRSIEAPDGEWRPATRPYLWRDQIILPLLNTDTGSAVLWAPLTGVTLDLPDMPSRLTGIALDDVLIIPSSSGAICVRELTQSGVFFSFRNLPIRSAMSPGPAFQAASGFVVSGSSGSVRSGWPYMPRVPLFEPGDGLSVAPLIYEQSGQWFHQFTSSDGRLFLCDSNGNPMPGWPLNGPGEAAGTPIMIDIDGQPGLELVAIGTLNRDYEVNAGPTPMHASLQSSIRLWHLPGTEDATALWAMRGGSPLGQAVSTPVISDSEGTGLLVENSHICYPVPLTGDDLHVRALLNEDARVNVTIYNLEGEIVLQETGWTAYGGEPFEVVFKADRLASGLYICRLQADSGVRSDSSVIPLAVAR